MYTTSTPNAILPIAVAAIVNFAKVTSDKCSNTEFLSIFITKTVAVQTATIPAHIAPVFTLFLFIPIIP